jgi:antitoxin component YwqK of YwqJK toxin-antitoxin module
MYNEDGSKITETPYHNGIIHGDKYVYNNDVLQFVYIFSEGKCNKVQEYGPGPKLVSESQINNGKLHGEGREYHENGICKHLFYHDNGILHGKDIYYDTRGKIHCVGNLLQGRKHGIYQYYNSLGALTHTEKYNNGVKI